MPTVTRKTPQARLPLFEIRKSRIQGRGAFALRPIRKGQRIVEYGGERISNEEADRRYDESKMRRHHTFLFTLDSKTVIDGAVNGTEAIYINHSCDPNCEAVIDGKHIYIHAIRTIQPGEELAYDYQYEYDSTTDAEFYACRCGASTCRGTIMQPPPKPRRSKPKTTAKKTTAKKKVEAKSSSRRTKQSQKKQPASQRKKSSPGTSRTPANRTRQRRSR